MQLNWLTEEFSICKINGFGELPERLHGVWFLGKTEEELSLVCETVRVPEHTVCREDGWRCFRAAGTLEFSLIGILSKITGALAQAQIGVFVVSTYDTDYVLVRTQERRRAQQVLEQAGYAFEGEPCLEDR